MVCNILLEMVRFYFYTFQKMQ